jgi:hypothetical protein
MRRELLLLEEMAEAAEQAQRLDELKARFPEVPWQ